jgi:hypothetical protein
LDFGDVDGHQHDRHRSTQRRIGDLSAAIPSEVKYNESGESVN